MGIRAKLSDRVVRTWLSRQSLETLQARLASRRGWHVLCYHSISTELDGYPYQTSATDFDAQLSFLREIYEIITVDELLAAIRNRALHMRDRPAAVITFDDGYRDNWTVATQILEKHNLPAALFVPRDLIRGGGQTHMDENELRSLAAHGLWTVGAHGTTHNVLPAFCRADQESELQDCNSWLSELLGEAPRGFAYPQGQISKTAIDLARQNYSYAFSTDRRLGDDFDPYQIRRHCIVQSENTLHAFAQRLMRLPMEG